MQIVVNHFCLNCFLQFLSKKTPLSGPGALKTRAGRKRRREDAESAGKEGMESLENEYRGELKILFAFCQIG